MSLFRRQARSIDDWPFDAPPNVAVITTRQIVTDGESILYVSHDAEDDGWQFHTGGQVAEADAKIVSLRSLVSRDDTLRELADLPPGWVAVRGRVGAEWQRLKPEDRQ